MGITWLVMGILMAILGTAPFGDHSLAIADAKVQYLDFFHYYKDVLDGNNSIIYSLTNGMGSNSIGLFSYYLASPLNLILFFFDSAQMNTVIDILIFLKIGLASGSFACFLQGRLYDRLAPLFTVLLSVCYGLMHYSFFNGSNVMWLDGMVLLPLMLLGTHLTVRKRSILPLALPTALSILANWYTGGINCLFCIIWLIFEFVLNEIDPETGETVPVSDVPGADMSGLRGLLIRLAGAIFRYGIAMVSGIAVSAVLFFPAVFSLHQGRGAEFYLKSHMNNVFRGNMADTISRYRIGGISDITGVSLYCGSLAMIGAIAFFISRRIRIRQKMMAAVLLAFTLLSFYWQPLFFIFSLLKRVDSYFSRYGYIGSLELLFLAASYLQHVYPARECEAKDKTQHTDLKRPEYYVPVISSVVFVILLFTVGDPPSLQDKGVLQTCISMLGAGICTTVLLVSRSAHEQKTRRLLGRTAAVLLTMITLGELLRSGFLLIRHNGLGSASEYISYVQDAETQLDTLRKYDSSYYRISQVGWRQKDSDTGFTANYNDALAYNYMGIGGYTSCPENDQMYLLDRLGYREENLCMNIVNTSFVPADAFLGVRYVFSEKYLPGLTKMPDLGKHNGKEAYLNPYALPLAFVYDGSMLPTHDYQDPFLYLEEIWTSLSGEEANLFTELKTTRTESENTVTWKAEIPDGNVVLYGNLPWEEYNPAFLQAGRGEVTGYARWLSPSVFSIPYDENDQTVEITITSEKPVSFLDEQFYALDLDRLQTLSDQISEGAEQVRNLQMENGKIQCTVTAHEGDSLFMTLPRTIGWRTYINGERVNTEEFGYCLTVIPLTEGENRIERYYQLPYQRKGIAATAAGILFLAVYELLIKKS